jgi:hypothetical protein
VAVGRLIDDVTALVAQIGTDAAARFRPALGDVGIKLSIAGGDKRIMEGHAGFKPPSVEMVPSDCQ